MTPRPATSNTSLAGRRVLHVTTVPLSLMFLRGHVAHQRSVGFDVHVASSPGAMLQEFGAEQKAAVHAIQLARGISPLADTVSLVRLWRLMRQLRPDVVHAHTPKAGLLGTLAARLARVPAVMLSVFGLPQMTRIGWSRWLLDFTTRLACSAADVVWADSPSMRDYLAASGLCRDDKAVVLGEGSVGGVDVVSEFNPDLFGDAERSALRRQYGIPDGASVIGFVGRIAKDKGMRELSQAWQTLREKHHNVHLLIVGPHDDRDPIPREVNEDLQLDRRVHLVGMRRDVSQHLAIMDVFVNPSYREGFGVANLEASAMRLPVVATRIPGCIDSVQDGVTGTLVPVRDAVALATAIEAYLVDSDSSAQHAAAGRQRVAQCFQRTTLWTALESEYRRLLGRNMACSRPQPAFAQCANVTPQLPASLTES